MEKTFDEMIKIKVGQIWEVIDNDFWSTGKESVMVGEARRKASIHLSCGEFIEIRYPFEWHFRTIDNVYLHANPTDILKHCRLYGMIEEKIRFGNRHKLKQILDDNLLKYIWESEVE